ncbi:hypothetical protein GCM10025858_14060 [Alicyclobacillus sacchari]|nr:hypothetical protein GCM10025858_14060 [Alicyclobacillus sacchari]
MKGANVELALQDRKYRDHHRVAQRYNERNRRDARDVPALICLDKKSPSQAVRISLVCASLVRPPEQKGRHRDDADDVKVRE